MKRYILSLILVALLTACGGPEGDIGPVGATGAAGAQGPQGPAGTLYDRGPSHSNSRE